VTEPAARRTAPARGGAGRRARRTSWENESSAPAPGLDFDWNLRPLMAAHHLWKSTQLAALLRQRGIALSASQVRRLVTGKPERLSLRVLVALCDIFGCTPGDLITITPRVSAAHRRPLLSAPPAGGPWRRQLSAAAAQAAPAAGRGGDAFPGQAEEVVS
jgi:DNA-binding Xre family transcriptional regulator